MNRSEIIEIFRVENPDITKNVISDALLHNWAKLGDKEICAKTRCIRDDGKTITTLEDDDSIDLVAEIDNFFDIDEFQGGGVAYNGKRLRYTTMAQLDKDHPSWRSRTSGVPTEYFRRGSKIFFDRPINSAAEDVTIYSILMSNDFDDDNKTPYNQLSYLEPFHGGILKYLQWKGKAKKGKKGESLIALEELNAYIKWMKREISGGRFGKIFFVPKHNRYSGSYSAQ